MHNRGVSRRRFAYWATAIALSAAAIVGVGAVLIVAPSTDEAVVETFETDAVEVAAPKVLPVDIAMRGVALETVRAVIPDAASTVASAQTSRVCDLAVTDWVRTESARASGSRTNLNVQVAGWRAGAAGAPFDSLRTSADECSYVEEEQGADRFTASRTEEDGQLAFGAVRFGDVIVLASASSASEDPTSAVDEALASADSILAPRLSKVCVDASSETDASLIERDPYGDGYDGYHTVRAIPLLNTSPVDQMVVDSVQAIQPLPSWQKPSPRPFPELAPIDLDAPAVDPTVDPAPTPESATDELPREQAPNIIDPATILPPKSIEPLEAPGDAPLLAVFGVQNARAMVPTFDVVGPGCGWKFAETLPPVVTKTQILEGSQSAIIDALVQQTSSQGQDMIDALSWPDRYRGWVTRATVAADWDAYRATVEDADAAMKEAKEKFEESVTLWREQLLDPDPLLPSESPTPTASPTASPTVDSNRRASQDLGTTR